jgi:DNA-binding transcriptional LysR family regulator
MRSLRARSIDMAICDSGLLEGEDTLQTMDTFSPLPGCVVVRSGHPLLKKRKPRMVDLLNYPCAQVVMLPPRVLRHLLPLDEGIMTSRLPVIGCPSLSLAVRVVAGSDAFALASLCMIRTMLESGAVVPLMREDWMWTEWRLVRLGRRVVSPVMSLLAQEIRRAHEQVSQEEAALQRQWLNAP